MRMQKGEWTQVYDLVPNKTISVKHYDELIAELTLLRKVAGAARRVMDAVMAQPQDVVERNIALAWLDAALAELDKEGER